MYRSSKYSLLIFFCILLKYSDAQTPINILETYSGKTKKEEIKKGVDTEYEYFISEDGNKNLKSITKYYPNGLPKVKIKYDSHLINEFTYDNSFNLIESNSKKFDNSDTSSVYEQFNIKYTYNNAGNLDSMLVYNKGIINNHSYYQYDSIGRILKDVMMNKYSTETFEFKYTIDNNDLTEVEVKSPVSTYILFLNSSGKLVKKLYKDSSADEYSYNSEGLIEKHERISRDYKSTINYYYDNGLLIKEVFTLSKPEEKQITFHYYYNQGFLKEMKMEAFNQSTQQQEYKTVSIYEYVLY